MLTAEVADSDAVIAESALGTGSYVNISGRSTVCRKTPHAFQGHDSTKTTIRYPYVIAETVNVGRRQLTGADFLELPLSHNQSTISPSADHSLLKSLESR